MAKKKKESFMIKLEDGKVLKSIVETLASIIDEVNIVITPNEFSVKAMDPSRICLLQLIIEKENFEEYECSKECNVGINLDDLDKIMKRSSANDTIILSYQEEDRKIKIKMQEGEMTRARTFSLVLIDVDIEDVPIDNLLKIEYPSSWSFDPDILVEAIKDAEIYSEVLNIEAIEKIGLKFTSYGQIGQMEYQLGLDDFIDVDLSKTQKGAFALTFLKYIMKLANITEKLQIFLKGDHPLKMLFNLLEDAKLSYFLAPRVEEVDFEGEEIEFEEVEKGVFEEAEEETPKETEEEVIEDTEESKKELEELEELVEKVK